jgi:hypothetical protein
VPAPPRSRGRIPEALWRAAVELARARGAGSVAEALRLNEGSLKRRMKTSRGQAAAKGPSGSPAFVEVEFPSAGSSRDSVVQVEDRTGTRLTVRLSGVGSGDVAAIARALWGSRS